MTSTNPAPFRHAGTNVAGQHVISQGDTIVAVCDDAADARRIVLCLQAIDNIADLLFPVEDPGQQWDASTIEYAADEVLRVYPRAADGDRTLA